jgi:hypothetical protein
MGIGNITGELTIMFGLKPIPQRKKEIQHGFLVSGGRLEEDGHIYRVFGHSICIKYFIIG